MNNLNKRDFWRKGSGEFLGFAIITPLILMLLMFVVSSAQIGTINQDLSYLAYNCCRAAVVSETQDVGVARAKEVFEYKYDIDEITAQHNYVPCEIEIIDGNGWQKGTMIKCTVRLYVDTLMPFTSGIREQSITMMIENGDLN